MELSPSKPKKVVLVVEDEPIQRMEMVDLVESAGYEVVEAADAAAAIAILETGLSIHIVMTDVEMPGTMDGIALAAAVRGRWPPIEIIVASARRTEEDMVLPDRSIFLPKPIRREAAVEALRKLAA